MTVVPVIPSSCRQTLPACREPNLGEQCVGIWTCDTGPDHAIQLNIWCEIKEDARIEEIRCLLLIAIQHEPFDEPTQMLRGLIEA